MSVLISILLTAFLLLSAPIAAAKGVVTYGQRLCHSDANLACLIVKKGDTWQSLWPEPEQRALAMRLNRLNIALRPGMQLAIPGEMDEAGALNLLPFPQQIGNQNERTILVSPRHLAWAAYEADGKFVRWGPASTGRDFCADIDEHCATPQGVFNIYRKQQEECISTKYPIPNGGAPMPYCMFFKGGFALHGSDHLPGYNDSHGCVRMLTADAQWLNQNFITVGVTKVIVRD